MMGKERRQQVTRTNQHWSEEGTGGAAVRRFLQPEVKRRMTDHPKYQTPCRQLVLGTVHAHMGTVSRSWKDTCRPHGARDPGWERVAALMAACAATD